MLVPRLDLRRPFLTLGLVVAAWLVLPGVVKRVIRSTAFELQAPLDVAGSLAPDLQDYWALRSRGKNELIAALQAADRTVAAGEIALQDNAALRAELERLESLLDLPPAPRYRTEVARVARRDFSGWWQQLVIRKGRAHGIPEGAPVIFAGGVVGRVRQVGHYTSVVELISSPGLRLAAAVEGDTRPLSYQGGVNPSVGPARGVADYVPEIYATTGQAKKLVTSGLGGVFPPGLVIGTLVKVEPSTDGLFGNGIVQLDPRLADLTEVAVLVPLDPAQAEITGEAEAAR